MFKNQILNFVIQIFKIPVISAVFPVSNPAIFSLKFFFRKLGNSRFSKVRKINAMRLQKKAKLCRKRENSKARSRMGEMIRFLITSIAKWAAENDCDLYRWSVNVINLCFSSEKVTMHSIVLLVNDLLFITGYSKFGLLSKSNMLERLPGAERRQNYQVQSGKFTRFWQLLPKIV